MGRSTSSAKTFGNKLDEAIQKIHTHKRRKIKDIFLDIGDELSLSGRTIESWKYGTLPDQQKLEKLVRYLFNRGRDLFNREWLHEFLVLGEHERPERLLDELFPIPSPALRQTPSALAASQPDFLPHIPFNVKDRLPEFMGREDKLQEMIKAISQNTQLCVIHGLPGVGKLTLASHYAHACRGDYPGGAVTIEVGLPKVGTGPGDLEARCIQALDTLAGLLGGIDLKDQHTLEDKSKTVKEKLKARQQRTLLILENVPSREELTYFLPEMGSHHVFIVTTSNSDLAIGADRHWFLNPFEVPSEPLQDDESLPVAVALLAFPIDPSWVENAADIEALRQIASYVGGLPLALWAIGQAIKVNQEKLSNVTPAEYCDRYLRMEDNRFTDLDERVRHALQFGCYELLSEPLKRSFAALGAFEDREFSAEAADAAMAQDGRRPEVNWVDELTDFSLIQVNRRGRQIIDGRPVTRFSLHPVVRMLASNRLSTDFSDEEPAIRQRVAQFHIDLAAKLAADFAAGRKHDFARLTLEWPNVQAAMEWFDMKREWPEFQRGLEVLTHPSLGTLGFLDTSGHWHEAVAWLTRAYQHATREKDILALPLLHFIDGVFALRRSDWQLAHERLEDAYGELATLPNANEDDLLLLAQVCQYIGELRTKRRDWDGALAALQQSEQILMGLTAEVAGYERGYTDIRRAEPLSKTGQDAKLVIERGLLALPPWPTAARISGYLNLGMVMVHMFSAEPDKAIEAWNAGKDDAEALGDVRRRAHLWRNIANIQAEYGQLEEALKTQSERYQEYEEIGDVTGMGETASNQGLVLLGLKRYDASRKWLDEAMKIGRKHALNEVQAYAAINLARWHIQQHDFTAAEQWLDQAENHRNETMASEYHRLRAEVAIMQGAADRALISADAARDAILSRLDHGSAFRVYAAALSHLGSYAESEAAYEEAFEAFEKNDYETALTKLSYANHLHRIGRDDEAETAESAALEAFEKLRLEPPTVLI